MKGILTWLGVVIVTIIIALLVFGARPGDLVQIPVNIFNDIVHPKPATADGPAQSGSAGAPAGASPAAAPASNAALNSAPVIPSGTPLQMSSIPLAPSSEGGSDLASVARSPQQWPKVVTLKEAVEFPAVMNGQVVGSVKVPAGSQVALVTLQPDQVELEYQGGRKTVPCKSTDVAERVVAARNGLAH